MDDDAIAEMFQSLGPVTTRRLFGGKGIYYRGHILAIEYKDEILLKADAHSASAFAAAGSTQWSYSGKRSQAVAMPYWSIPDEAHDDPEEMSKWVRLAYEAAMRAK